MKIKRILLDMDEVLCDFVGAACRIWALELEEVEANWEAGRWDMSLPIQKTLVQKGRRESGHELTQEEFWKPINNNAGFWIDLKATEWMCEIMDLAGQITPDIHIISSPSHCPTSYNGKVDWLKREFGRKFDHFALTPHKEIFAGPGVVLIDDRESNCISFVEVGGEAILFPRYHNPLHSFRHDPMTHVKSQLVAIAKETYRA